MTKENIVETSYVRDFYIDGVEAIQTIAEQNQDNPIKTKELSSAYISGTVKDIDAKDAQKAAEPLNALANAYAENQLQEFDVKQADSALAKTEASLAKAYNMAIASYENDEPINVQTIKTNLYLKTLDDEVADGRTSLEMAQKLKKSLAHGRIANDLTSALISDNLTDEQKYQILVRYFRGETGNDAIDGSTHPEERLQFVLESLNASKQISSLRTETAARALREREAAFRDKYVELSPYIFEYNGYDTPERNRFKRREALKALYRAAVTPEQIDKVHALEKAPFKDDPYAVDEIDVAFAFGTANKEYLDELLKNRYISTSTYGKNLDKMRSPLFQNQQSNGYKNAKEMIETAFPIDKTMATNVSVVNGLLTVNSSDPNAKLQFDAINKLNVFASKELRSAKDFNEFVNGLLEDSGTARKFVSDSQKKEIDNKIKVLNNNKGGKEIYNEIKNNMSPIKDSNGNTIERDETEAIKLTTYQIQKRLEENGAPEKTAFDTANEIMKLYRSAEWN